MSGTGWVRSRQWTGGASRFTPRRLTGSLNLDVALQEALPNAPRWDYGIGYRPNGEKADFVHWVEVHPASDREVPVVIAKLDWLKQWTTNNAPALATLACRYVWVSSGKTRLTPTAPALRHLATKGCQNVGRRHVIG